MNIAVTADIHLSADGEHPERLRGLVNILDSLMEKEIRSLLIAGDLFDKDCGDYSEFETVCRQYPKVNIIVIPGNHDPDISGRMIVGENIRIFDSPVQEIIDDMVFVFLPYSPSGGMGEHLAEFDLPQRWVLVGHGDYFGGPKQRNPYEKGTYMPLYRRDIEEFSPWKVFLGHIHKPLNTDNLFYPGSPCGIDINETGRRRYLIFNTTTGRVTSETLKTDLIFQNEKFLVIPDDNEIERLRSDARRRISAWRLDEKDIEKTRIRIAAAGYTADRQAVMDCLKKEFAGFTFVSDEEPDISSLRAAEDNRRKAIARRTIQLIEEMEWEFGGSEPEKEEVIEAALSVIYGGRGR